MFFAALFCTLYTMIIETQNRRPNDVHLQKSSPQSYKTQIKIIIIPFPGFNPIANSLMGQGCQNKPATGAFHRLF